MISLNNDPTPLLGFTVVASCPCLVCMCVSVNETSIIGIAVLYCFVLHFFCTQWQIRPFSACLLLSDFIPA